MNGMLNRDLLKSMFNRTGLLIESTEHVSSLSEKISAYCCIHAQQNWRNTLPIPAFVTNSIQETILGFRL